MSSTEQKKALAKAMYRNQQRAAKFAAKRAAVQSAS